MSLQSEHTKGVKAWQIIRHLRTGGVKWLLQKIKSVQTAVTQLKNGKTLKRLDGTNLTFWYNDDFATIRFQAQNLTVPKNDDKTIFVLPSGVTYEGWHIYTPGLILDTSWYPAGTCELNLDKDGFDLRFPQGTSSATRQIMATVTLPRSFFTIN